MKAIIAKYYQPVILFVLTLTVASIFSTLNVDPYHHGIMLKPAIDVAHGQMLFRDTSTAYGAGALTTLLQAWALSIFGDYLIVIQIETALFYGLISLCLYYLWLNILPPWLTTMSVVIWLLLAPYFAVILPFHPWSSVYALFFQLLSLLLVLHALHKQSRLMLMLAGGVAVLAFWCRQPVGIFHCASLAFFLTTTPLITGRQWRKAMIDCSFFIAGIAVASATFFVWLALNSAIHDWYLQSIKAAFSFGIKYSLSDNLYVAILKSLFPFSRKYYLVWNLLPIVCLSLLAMLAVKRWRNSDSVINQLPLYGLLLVSLASWMQYYPVTCIRHCYWAATPMIGLFSYGAWHLCSFKEKKMQIMVVCLILACVFGSDIGKRIYNGFYKIVIFNKKIEEPKVLRGMYVTINDAITYKGTSISLNNAIKRNSFHYLVNLTMYPLYLTFIGPQKNIHPTKGFTEVWNIKTYPDYKIFENEFINTKHPLVLSYADEKFLGWTCVDVYNMIDENGLLAYNNPTPNHRCALYRFTGNNETP
jgi:hypothetical protein